MSGTYPVLAVVVPSQTGCSPITPPVYLSFRCFRPRPPSFAPPPLPQGGDTADHYEEEQNCTVTSSREFRVSSVE
jgi:hypothetical protein